MNAYIKKFTVAITGLMMATFIQAAPFGNSDDLSYAKSVWNALARANLVGEDAIQGTPYDGQDPHGKILVTLDSTITVHNNLAGPNGDKGVAIVKRNYGGPSITKKSVADNPYNDLKAVTVMFKREGFDPEDQDWFWVKFKPNGGLHTNPKGIKLAGKVAKGMPKGCIACHKAASGGDFVFNNDRFQ
jgi:hypothetical protein